MARVGFVRGRSSRTTKDHSADRPISHSSVVSGNSREPFALSTPNIGGWRRRLLAATAFAGTFAAVIAANPQSALAACTSAGTNPRVVNCAATTTLNSTNTNFGFNPSISRHQDLTTGGTVNVTVNGLINGYGQAITQGQAGAAINYTNNSTVTLSSGIPSAGGTSALNLTGSGGLVTYTGNGAVLAGGTFNTTFGYSTNAITIANTGSGGITLTSAGNIQGNSGVVMITDNGAVNADLSGAHVVTTDNVAGTGVLGTATGGGNVTITMNSGGVHELAIPAYALLHTGIAAHANTGNATVTSGADIAVNGVPYGTGLEATVAGGTGQATINMTGGTIFAANYGINATNGGLGGVYIGGPSNAFTGGTISMAGGTGINASVTGSSGGITILSGTTIDPPNYGIDAQINNALNGNNISITQNAQLDADISGIRAITNGTGSVLVGGSGDVTGNFAGAGAANAATGDYYGIYAAQNGSIGNVTVTGSGATSGNIGIGAYINGTGGGGIMIDRSGTVTVTGTGGTGIDAYVAAGPGSVTITGVGNIDATTAGSSGIAAATASGGNVSINGTGTINSDSTGVYARSFGTGAITVTNTGAITSANGYGIFAQSAGGNVAVTPGSTVSGATGISAQTTGNGTVNVTNIAAVTGTAGDGIFGSVQNGNLNVTANSGVDSTGGTGIHVESNGAGTLTVTGTGTISGTVGGISAVGSGAGPGAGVDAILITGTGNTVGTGTGYGINAQTTNAANGSNVTVNRSGTVNAGGTGINATSSGSGRVTVTGVGNVLSTGGTGINARSTGGGNVTVSPNGTVQGLTGIDGRSNGVGTVTVTTRTGAAGNVTGTAGKGINTQTANGANTVHANSATVSGTTYGVDALSTGSGPVLVDGAAAISGDNNAGIRARSLTGSVTVSGSGTTTSANGAGIIAQSGTGAVLVDRAGNVSGGTDGINALSLLNTVTVSGAGNVVGNSGTGIAAATGTGAILVDRSGLVDGGTFGINAISGTGSITVTGTGNVGSLVAPSDTGIQAITGAGSFVSITPAGTVTGGRGINAVVAAGNGTLTVTTAAGAAGNVSGTISEGIRTRAVDGNTVITNNAAMVSGATSAVDAASSGLGTLTVTGAGDYAGGTTAGILAVMTGAGPVAGNDGIIISGTGNTSATAGSGIVATITNAGNASNINITRSGTITAGADGINATTAGTGDVTINGPGDTTGTGGTGMIASSQGGNVSVTPQGFVTGTNGINANTTLAGTVTVNTDHNVTATGGIGITTSAEAGLTTVNVTANSTVQATGDGINSTSTSGNINVTVTGHIGVDNSTRVGGMGINATSNTGNITLANNSNSIFSVGDGMHAVTGGVVVVNNGDNTVPNPDGRIDSSAGNGVWAQSTGAAGSVTVNSGINSSITAALDGIHATYTNAAGPGSVIVNSNGTVVSNTADGIDASTTSSNVNSNVTVNVNGNVSAGNDASDVGVRAAGRNGLITVTQDGTHTITNTGGGDGIVATAVGTGLFGSSSGSVVVTAGNISARDGVNASVGGVLHNSTVGTVTVDTVAGTTITATRDGIITSTGTGSSGSTQVTMNSSTINATRDGIRSASGAGSSGDVTVDVLGTSSILATNRDGAVASTGLLSSGNAAVNVRDTSSIVAGRNGATANSLFGSGDATVNTDAGTSVTGTTGAGIIASTSVGNATVDAQGTVTGATGISATSLFAGNVSVTTGSQLVTGTANQGILATSGNGQVDVTVGTGGIQAEGNGVQAAINFASVNDLTVTQNGAIVSNSGNGILANIFSAGSSGNILINANNDITALSGDGIRANNAGSGNSVVNVGNGTFFNRVVVGGDPGIVNDTNGGNAEVHVGNFANVTGGVGIIDRQNNAAGLGIVDVTVGIVSNVVGDGSSADPLNGNGIYANNVGTNIAATTNVSLGSLSTVTATSDGLAAVSGIFAGSAGGDITVTTAAISLVSVDAAGTASQGINATTTGADANVTVTTGALSGIVVNNGVDAQGILAQGIDGAVSVTTGLASLVNVSGGTGIAANATGAGPVTVTNNGLVNGSGGNGIQTSAFDGLTTITNASTFSNVTGSVDGIRATNTGGAGNIDITNNGRLLGGGVFGGAGAGIAVRNSGTGTTLITNNGVARGDGSSFDTAVISITSDTATHVVNTANGDIRSNGAAYNDYAIATTTLGGAVTIDNAGYVRGRIDLTSGVDIFNNTGTWEFAGLNALYGGNDQVNNAAGGLIRSFGGMANFSFDGGGADVVNNSGTFQIRNGTGNSAGVLTFTGLENFNNAGGLVDMRLNEGGVTGTPVNTVSTGGNWNGTQAGGVFSRLGVDTSVGAGNTSDRLLIGGNATGTGVDATRILLNDTNTGPGAYNPTGITLVNVAGTTNANFRLGGLTGGSMGEFLQPNRGPLGAVKKDFWFYPLLQVPGGGGSTSYVLFGLPDEEAFQLSYAAGGAQNIWYETANSWMDKQNDLLRQFAGGQMAYAADLPTKAPVKTLAPIPVAGWGTWAKAVGSWTDRNATQSTSAGGTTFSFDTGYKQDTYGVVGGLDWTKVTATDLLQIGVMGGYVESRLSFNSSTAPSSFKYHGGALGLSATYIHNGWFIDGLVKADLLTLDIDMSSLSGFGTASASGINVTSVGALGNFGYRWTMPDWYAEMIGTATYVRTSIDNASMLGMGINWNNADSFRLAGGARIGKVVSSNGLISDWSILGRVWNEFQGENTVNLITSGPLFGLTDNGLTNKPFGEVTGMVEMGGLTPVGWSGFANVGVKFNSDFTTATAKGGVRYQW